MKFNYNIKLLKLTSSAFVVYSETIDIKALNFWFGCYKIYCIIFQYFYLGT